MTGVFEHNGVVLRIDTGRDGCMDGCRFEISDGVNGVETRRLKSEMMQNLGELMMQFCAGLEYDAERLFVEKEAG